MPISTEKLTLQELYAAQFSKLKAMKNVNRETQWSISKEETVPENEQIYLS